MFIGDGAKLVRDAFELAKEKAPAIIFIDELDAIGTKRFDSDKAGDREVQRTMLELLNQLDGFSSDARIKVRRSDSGAGEVAELGNRSLPPRTESTFSTLLCFDRVGWTERLNSPFQTSRPGKTSCRSTRESSTTTMSSELIVRCLKV